MQTTLCDGVIVFCAEPRQNAPAFAIDPQNPQKLSREGGKLRSDIHLLEGMSSRQMIFSLETSISLKLT